MTPTPTVLRLAAFPDGDDPGGGNPAGVVLDASGLDPGTMQRVAAEVGYSETAFLARDGREPTAFDVRYFAPAAEVPFCGHATIAAGVALGPGRSTFRTESGPVEVAVAEEDGRAVATLTSVAPLVTEVDPADVTEALDALGWRAEELDPALPVRVAAAGAQHLVLAARTYERLARLDYDVPRLTTLMQARAWTTVALVWRESPDVFRARNPFPVGGVVEDPATGAAAAALGGYLRVLGLVGGDADLTVLQGAELGRPSRIRVRMVAGEAGVRVSGTAVPIPEGS
jgi:PhzF family phenazine biosynthesis protein